MSNGSILIIAYLSVFLFLVGGAYYLFCIRNKRFESLKESLKLESLRSDLKYSILSILIFTASYWAVLKLSEYKLNFLYSDFSSGGIKQYIITSIILVVGYDAYFYWSHRLLHVPWWYKNVHVIHHRSRHPTPLSAMAFHPLEALLQALYLPILSFVVPTHISFLIVAPTFIMILSIIGHLGFEFLSDKFRTKQVGKHFGSSSHHHLHHHFPHSNFGFLFIFWDHVINTQKNGGSLAQFPPDNQGE